MSSTIVQSPEREFFGVAPETAIDVPGPPGRGTALIVIPQPKQAPSHWLRLPDLPRAAIADATLEADRGTLFCFVPVFLGGGSFAYFCLPFEPVWWHLPALLAVSSACLFLCWSRYVTRLLILAVVLTFAGGALAELETWRAGTKMLGGEISTRLTGRITATDYLANGRIRLTLDVISTERPKLRYAPDRVRVSARTLPAGLRAGDVVTGVVRLMPMLGPTRPGSYDFSFESYFDGIGATGFFLKNPELAAVADEPGWKLQAVAYLENLRDRLADRIRFQIGGAEGEIAAALVMGVRAGIPEDVNEALRRTGLAHILSISGLHMALVAATVIWTLRFAFALIPGYAVRHPVRKYAAAAALLVLAVYLCISGNQVAALRSFIMIAVMLVAMIFDHAALTMRNLALSALLILVFTPHEIVGPSFQMSFAATAALIGAYGIWERRPQRPALRKDHGLVRRATGKLMLHVGGAAMTSLLAGTATTVFGIYHFQRVSPLSVFANLAVMPAVSVLVMPPALFAVLLMPVGLDWIPLAIMGEGIWIMDTVAEWFSTRSPIDAVGTIDPLGVVLISVALLLGCLLTTRLRLSALPFAAVGFAICLMTQRPTVLIAEDALLVGVSTDDGSMAVTRSRPNAFTLQNWLHATARETVQKPEALGEAALPIPSEAKPGVFQCTGSTCIGRFKVGLVVAVPTSAEAAPLCGNAAIIVVADPTAKNVCEDATTHVITRRDLARRGTAEMVGSSLTYAIAEPYRPWHENRQYSREARGLPRWKPKPRPTGDASQTPREATGDNTPSKPSTCGSDRPACPEP